MESEELFSQLPVHSEELIVNKENVQDVIEEVVNDINSPDNESIPTEQNENASSDQTTNSSTTRPTTENASSKKDKSTNEQRVTQLPLSRIRNLMKLDPDLHIASTEAAVIVAKATEMFIDSLTKEAYVHTIQAKKKTIQKRDVDMAIASVDSLMFLEGAMNF